METMNRPFDRTPHSQEHLMRAAICLAFAASILLAGLACGKTAAPFEGQVVASPLARDTAPSVSSTDLAALVTDDTTFAFNLYRTATAGDETSNFFFSPHSISLALAMTYAGAHGETATQMATAMHFGLSPDRLHPAFDLLDLTITRDAQALHPSDFQLSVANSFWSDESVAFQGPFLDTLALDYGAGVRVVDFRSAPDASRVAINSWVSDETHAKIPQLLPAGSIGSDTRFVLVNAIYFFGAWKTPFDATKTAPATFTHLDGSAVQVNEMHVSGELGYAEANGWQAVELPYSGDKASMIVIVPQAGQFASVEAVLSAQMIAGLVSSLQPATVTLSLPKFTIQGATISLKQELSALGMTDAFDPAKADFSAMVQPASEPIFIGDVLHQAFVNVDENGTEAAAATAVTGVTGLPGPQVTLDVNRPFLFLLRSTTTNAILFAGRVLDPK
jgi:serpin B